MFEVINEFTIVISKEVLRRGGYLEPAKDQEDLFKSIPDEEIVEPVERQKCGLGFEFEDNDDEEAEEEAPVEVNKEE